MPFEVTNTAPLLIFLYRIRLIKKFPSDENFQKYLEQIRVQDYKNAEQSVHTLKGVASNLGLTLISDLTQLIVDEIRGERDYKKIEEWTHELEPIYQKTVDKTFASLAFTASTVINSSSLILIPVAHTV